MPITDYELRLRESLEMKSLAARLAAESIDPSVRDKFLELVATVRRR